MPRPGVGNPGNKGNKNAKGRPGIKETEWHKNLWTNEQEVHRLENKIASGIYAARDVYALKVLKADVQILKNLADKVLANLVDVTSDGEKIEVSWQIKS